MNASADAENAEEIPETIQITTLNANKEEMELTVPYDPQRIAILDLAASYDALSEIAPVIYLATDTEIGLVESVTKNATTIASLFGLESEVEEKTADFAERIEALQAVAEGKTALVGMTTSGSFNLLGNDGRCSLIGVEIGFHNLTASNTNTAQAAGEQQGNGAQGGNGSGGQGQSGSAHGNESSFETVLAENPDYIFVMDRDSAIGTEGAQLAKEIMEKELLS